MRKKRPIEDRPFFYFPDFGKEEEDMILSEEDCYDENF